MKSKSPRSVKFDAATDDRLSKLLEKMDGKGIKFPTVLNMAVAHLLDQLDSGASIVIDEKGIRLAHFEVLPVAEKKKPVVVELAKPEAPAGKGKKVAG